jgi:hypothetical protein
MAASRRDAFSAAIRLVKSKLRTASYNKAKLPFCLPFGKIKLQNGQRKQSAHDVVHANLLPIDVTPWMAEQGCQQIAAFGVQQPRWWIAVR